MSYAAIDPIINAWMQKHSLYLHTGQWSGRPIRAIYVSSTIGECFQISVREPQDGNVTIDVESIETQNDEELTTSVTTPQLRLGNALEDVLKTVYSWMTRNDASAARFIAPRKA